MDHKSELGERRRRCRVDRVHWKYAMCLDACAHYNWSRLISAMQSQLSSKSQNLSESLSALSSKQDAVSQAVTVVVNGWPQEPWGVFTVIGMLLEVRHTERVDKAARSLAIGSCSWGVLTSWIRAKTIRRSSVSAFLSSASDWVHLILC